jgi:hypothetical protein
LNDAPICRSRIFFRAVPEQGEVQTGLFRDHVPGQILFQGVKGAFKVSSLVPRLHGGGEFARFPERFASGPVNGPPALRRQYVVVMEEGEEKMPEDGVGGIHSACRIIEDKGIFAVASPPRSAAAWEAVKRSSGASVTSRSLACADSARYIII